MRIGDYPTSHDDVQVGCDGILPPRPLAEVLFVHAGLLPEMLDHRSLEELNVAFHGALKHASTSKQMKKDEPKLLGGHGPVWARDYAYGRSNICQLAQQVLQKVDADRMVVGHTIQRDFQVHSKCNGQIILGDTAISSAYGGAMSFIEYDGSEVKARYPGSEAVVALPEVGLPDVTSGDVQRGSGMRGPQIRFRVCGNWCIYGRYNSQWKWFPSSHLRNPVIYSTILF